MTEERFSILVGGTAEFTEKRSRFIAYTSPAEDEEAARAFLARLRKEHYDARHCCSAWVLGAEGERQRSNDDGEPGGTAGMPILEVLRRKNLTNAVLAVVRYFGGIKLGAGGLTRAYAHAAALGVAASRLARRVTLRRLLVTVDYDLLSTIESWARREGLQTEEPLYAEQATLRLLVAPEAAETASRAITDRTAGRAVFGDGGILETLEPVDDDGTREP